VQTFCITFFTANVGQFPVRLRTGTERNKMIIAIFDNGWLLVLSHQREALARGIRIQVNFAAGMT
jgi:hypothetical protein